MKYTLSFLLTLISISIFASHNSAGEITYEQTGEKTVLATIHTYTHADSPTDRDSLQICWGDGQCEFVQRNSEEPLLAGRKHNQYIAEHEYNSFGEYVLYMSDPFRNPNTANLPFADQILFHIQSQFKLDEDFNSSPVFLEEPYPVAYEGVPYFHVPNAWDAEGDSLVFNLVSPYAELNTPVGNYLYPNDVLGNSGAFGIHEETGLVGWVSPETLGEFVVAFEVREYRGGALIGTTLRDMSIDVHPLSIQNSPPVVNVDEDEYFLTPGDAISFDVNFMDNENGVLVSATGGPFILSESPAEFDAPTDIQMSPFVEGFFWQTTLGHSRSQPYTLVFTAFDDASESMIGQRLVKIWVGQEPLSVEIKVKKTEWTIFPNPATGFIEVNVEEKSLEGYIVEIWDNNGRRFLSDEKENIRRIWVGDWPSGIYYFLLKNKGDVIGRKKIIKK